MTPDIPAHPVGRPIAQSAAVAKPAKPKTRKAKAGVKSASKKPANKKPATKKPTGKKSPQDINKSAEIRKVAAAMKAKNQKPRPSLIMAELKKLGVVVSSPQVSMVLKKMGFRPLRKRKKAAAANSGAAPSKAAANSTSKAAAVSLEDLLAAKKMAGSLGGTDKAIAALQALKRFEG
jgi:hypothetical protein